MPGTDPGPGTEPAEPRVPAQLDADEGEPDIEAFAGDEKTLEPGGDHEGDHGYGYE